MPLERVDARQRRGFCLGLGVGAAFALSRPALARIDPYRLLVQAARQQVGVTQQYTPAYVRIAYPMGDVPRHQGVCTDVLIRALRDAHKQDLQVLVHQDMRAHFNRYPKTWGLARPDPNIDHRRVPNLRVYLARTAQVLPVSALPKDYAVGDLVTSMIDGKLPHIMIVSDKKTAGGTPLVIHNIGAGAREEDALFAYPINGHYKLKL